MSEFVALSLIVGGIVIGLLLLRRVFLSTSKSKHEEANDSADFALSGLVLQLADRSTRDLTRNRLLAIGPGVIPELVSELVYHRFHADSAPPELLSELEALISDFGPSAIMPIMDRLSRWSPTHRCGPSLIRIIESLGDENFHHLMTSQQSLRPFVRDRYRFLNHLMLRRSDVRTCSLLLDAQSELPADELLVTMQSREWATLWLRLSVRGQESLLEWLMDWPNLLDVSFLEFLLLQGEANHLPDILRLVALNPHPQLLVFIEELCEHADGEISSSAKWTRSNFSESGAQKFFEGLLRAELRRERVVALRGGVLAGLDIPQHAEALRVVRQDLLWTDTNDTAELANLLYQKLAQSSADGDQNECELLALLYPVFESERTVAYERLLALSSSPVELLRVSATLALTLHNDQRAREAFRRCMQVIPSEKFKYRLQMVASGMGASGARLVAKRLIGKGHRVPLTDPSLNYSNGGRLLLSLLRCMPFASASDILLELIEADGQNPMAPMLALTLKSGGRGVRQEVSKALSQPERGLVLPAVRYLSICPDPLLIDDLMTVYGNFDVVRTQVLTVIEYLGPIGLAAIRKSIESGGDDRELDPLLETESWLQHCIDEVH